MQKRDAASDDEQEVEVEGEEVEEEFSDSGDEESEEEEAAEAQAGAEEGEKEGEKEGEGEGEGEVRAAGSGAVGVEGPNMAHACRGVLLPHGIAFTCASLWLVAHWQDVQACTDSLCPCCAACRMGRARRAMARLPRRRPRPPPSPLCVSLWGGWGCGLATLATGMACSMPWLRLP